MMRLAVLILVMAVAACDPPPPADVPAEEAVPVIVNPNMTVTQWRAASPDLQATYFRGAVSAHITDEAQNETQRQFDDNLALDLRDCVNVEIEKAEPTGTGSIRPFIARCLSASGMPAPG